MEFTREDSRRSTMSESVSSYSSGFQSMIGSPLDEQDIWANVQDLETRMNSLERKTKGHRNDASKLVLENAITLTPDNIDELSKYRDVEIKIAIVAKELRDPHECTCSHHHCCGSCSNSQHTSQSMLDEVNRKLQEYMKANEMLLAENRNLKTRFGSQHVKEDKQKQANEDDDSCVLEVAKETSNVKIEEVVTSHVEEKQRYSIRYVMDQSKNKKISLNDALMDGIINLTEGKYYNNMTGEALHIEEAMRQNLIDVAFKTTNRGDLHRSSFGILTMTKKILPKGTLLVKAFKDTHTGDMVSKEVAIKRGITNKSLSIYRNIATDEVYRIVDAIEKGYVTLEDEMGDNKEPEVMHCFYKVSGVMDKRSDKMLSFHDAVTRGIVLKDHGLCKDTTTGKFQYVGYALISGIMKVDPVEDTSMETLSATP